ncbi:peptidoglycan DD-metalloendopeptidase family protein [Parasalinivibrio latis]|uniref:peptidoglycan DD-metalloendopeptidase family protein n=1 Tax=Parasalinivibrio latis TaxID=2952610 RepID=UPI0030DF4FF8
MRQRLNILKKHLRARASCSGALLCLLASLSSFPHTALADEAQLKGVNQEISRQQSQLAAQSKKLTSLQATLKKQEQALASTAREIHDSEQTLSRIEGEIATLTRQQNQLEQQRLGQQELLKELIQAQYKAGSDSELKTWLGEENRSDLDRMTVYSEALAKARATAIENLAATDTELQLKRHQLSQQQQAQEAEIARLESRQKKLKREQADKKKTAGSIRRQISSDKAYLSELQANEKRLKEELARAAERARVKMDGLGKLKGRLNWPVKGKILHRYGTNQTGDIHWQGMVISAPNGTTVRAVQDGKVVMSNWLRGYGLMLVIDHGKGDMSLYGYNQTLLKNLGDTVKAGDPIALVGDSGGQTQSGLYFEIRRKGNPTNPLPWLKR